MSRGGVGEALRVRRRVNVAWRTPGTCKDAAAQVALVLEEAEENDGKHALPFLSEQDSQLV